MDRDQVKGRAVGEPCPLQSPDTWLIKSKRFDGLGGIGVAGTGAKTGAGTGAIVISIYYDGECPFCTRYVQMVRLQRTASVQLVDLRENVALRRELSEAGFDLDGGMVVEDGSARYGGDKAVAYIASLTTPSDWFNRLNRWVFSKPALAATLYPVLRAGRWFVLFLMGRSFIAETAGSNTARQEIFATIFALFSIFHFSNYAFGYKFFPPSWDLLLVLAAALCCSGHPRGDCCLH